MITVVTCTESDLLLSVLNCIVPNALVILPTFKYILRCVVIDGCNNSTIIQLVLVGIWKGKVTCLMKYKINPLILLPLLKVGTSKGK